VPDRGRGEPMVGTMYVKLGVSYSYISKAAENLSSEYFSIVFKISH